MNSLLGENLVRYATVTDAVQLDSMSSKDFLSPTLTTPTITDSSSQGNYSFMGYFYVIFIALNDPLLLSPGASLDCQLGTILAHGMDITERTPTFCTELQERELLVSLHKRTIGLYNNVLLPESGLDKLLEISTSPIEVYKIKGTQYYHCDGQIRLQDFSLKNRVYRNLDGTVKYDATGVQMPNFVSSSSSITPSPNNFGAGELLFFILYSFIMYNFSSGRSSYITSYSGLRTCCSLFIATCNG